MKKTNLVVFKKQKGEIYNAYSFVDEIIDVLSLKKQGVLFAVVEGERKEIYTKDDVLSLLKVLPKNKREAIKIL